VLRLLPGHIAVTVNFKDIVISDEEISGDF